MEKKTFIIEYGYRDVNTIEVVCTGIEVENIAYAIYLGWLPNSPRRGLGFCAITDKETNDSWCIEDCM